MTVAAGEAGNREITMQVADITLSGFRDVAGAVSWGSRSGDAVWDVWSKGHPGCTFL